MKTISGLGLGLSLVFGFLLLALVGELYYLLRLKKHKNKKRVTSQDSDEDKEDQQQQQQQRISYVMELINLLCIKKSQPLQQHNNNNGEEGENSRNPEENQDLELGLMKHLNGSDTVFETELMKLHNQRFLYTIMEETKTDLESENDYNTPGLTPLASSPAIKSPPLESYQQSGINNPLFESYGELEFNRFYRSSSSSSPPPKFKFMRDAEEKLRRRLIEEAKRRELLNVTEGSFMKFMVNREMKKQSIQESDETVSFYSSSLSVANISIVV
ncbi:unnamed protein product [Cochlearia groenlandica]